MNIQTAQIFFIMIYFSSFSESLRINTYSSGQGSPSNITTSQDANNTAIGSDVNTKVEIKVYYEALCPASVDFFKNQLAPAAKYLGSYVEVVMIPYGYTKTKKVHGSYKFRCQHGPEECRANILHACAIDTIRNNTLAVFFNTCLMQNSVYRHGVNIEFASTFNWCGYKYKVNLKEIRACLYGVRGTTLLNGYGEATRAFKPRYVPFVVVNGAPDEEDAASTNLMAVACHLLPSPPSFCDQY